LIEDIVKLKNRGLTLQEIAKKMNISLGKVQYRWNKYRQQVLTKAADHHTPDREEATKWKMPFDYNESLVCLMPICPHRLYAYWSFSNTLVKMAEHHFRTKWDALPKVLKIYDVTDIVFCGHNAHRTYEVNLPPMTNNWFIHSLEADRNYIVDVGTRTFDDSFFTLLRSNPAETSNTTVSLLQDHKLERWKEQERSQPEWFENFSTYSYYQTIR
jgi:uncharacterized protein